MDVLKKQKKSLRLSFTSALRAFSTKLESDCSIEAKIVAFQNLETKMTELDAVHSAYKDALFESGADETDINRELESDDAVKYKTQYLTAKRKISEIQREQRNRRRTTKHPTPSTSDNITRTVSTNALKPSTSKFSEFEPKFGGNIKDWLPFWSKFKKINENPSISKEDKMQYLQQAMIPDSCASEIVRSFLPTGENYEKAISSLKNCFGRDDIIVEFYVRKLLGLVLQNAQGNTRLSLTSLYNKLECYIRIMKTLGMTMNNCAAMLYPLVESSLPEEVLRAWQRNEQREAMETNGQGETTNRKLAKLLRFLQSEVESQEDIGMALADLSLSTK
ncbi:uncharacterized protein LOC105253407 [Camponotus floridanus]|uniref:uncharacterized protein LOC105253407 n=1 Tax=Camponotus floridanus TaxID=104421 RepID=UPI00059BA426|nr:uncharacterized protein LOC105253407 [Camponotus floridanus]XP_025271231.1 uncharacterized protein LOC105253407 [Camponotus floridanus]